MSKTHLVADIEAAGKVDGLFRGMDYPLLLNIVGMRTKRERFAWMTLKARKVYLRDD